MLVLFQGLEPRVAAHPSKRPGPVVGAGPSRPPSPPPLTHTIEGGASPDNAAGFRPTAIACLKILQRHRSISCTLFGGVWYVWNVTDVGEGGGIFGPRCLCSSIGERCGVSVLSKGAGGPGGVFGTNRPSLCAPRPRITLWLARCEMWATLPTLQLLGLKSLSHTCVVTLRPCLVSQRCAA